MNRKVFLLLLVSACAICGCDKKKTSSSSEKVMDEYKQYGDVMNDFIPEVGKVKLLFKHSLEETVGDDGEAKEHAVLDHHVLDGHFHGFAAHDMEHLDMVSLYLAQGSVFL